jgi:hypothetical protein
MKPILLILLCRAIALLFVIYGEEAAVLRPETDELYIVITTGSFQYILDEGVARPDAAQTGESFLANQARIMRHLRVDVMPGVTVSFWAREHSEEFYAEMKNRILIRSNGNIQSALGITEKELGSVAEGHRGHPAGL